MSAPATRVGSACRWPGGARQETSGLPACGASAFGRPGGAHIGEMRIGIALDAGTWLVTAWCHSGTSGFSSGK